MAKFIDEYRDAGIAKSITKKIYEKMPDKDINLMEVCGGHTVTIFKSGIRDLLPPKLKLISGPGCPVCVTDNSFIDMAIELARREDVIIATFGDMIKVPGSNSSLSEERGLGADVRICYSSMDAIEIAMKNPEKEVVFLGIGFETTAPTVAASIIAASEQNLTNYCVLSAHKTMPQAMRTLLDADEIAINGFICPGHVSTITGTGIYEFISHEYGVPCVISGFEPDDILESIYMLVKQLAEKRVEVENQYTRSVRKTGNRQAIDLMNRVFEPVDINWRGIGVIPGSGLDIKADFHEFNARKKFEIDLPFVKEFPGCICGDIMRGIKTPLDCKLFRKVCTPQDPKGACMVSDEGTCATYYKYG